MRLAAAIHDGSLELHVVRPESDSAYAVPPQLVLPGDDPLRAALGAGEETWRSLRSFAEICERRTPERQLSSLELAAPVTRPGKIICLASNYRAHMEESNVQRRADAPWLFVKPSSSVIGPDATIVLPAEDAAVDWEVELAVVIGRTCSHVPAQYALEAVAGYTVGNDVSLRPQNEAATPGWDDFFAWMSGKWHDTFAPLGPWLVTPDELGDLAAVTLTLKVNSSICQDGKVGQMILGVPDAIAAISAITTLEPGDVVLTGTPSGVGAASGKFLAAGDVVEATVDGIGTLRNPVAYPSGSGVAGEDRAAVVEGAG